MCDIYRVQTYGQGEEFYAKSKLEEEGQEAKGDGY